jgi:hypothetical protein
VHVAWIKAAKIDTVDPDPGVDYGMGKNLIPLVYIDTLQPEDGDTLISTSEDSKWCAYTYVKTKYESIRDDTSIYGPGTVAPKWEGWVYRGVDTIKVGTENIAGIVKSSSDSGKVLINTDATMTVNGYSSVSSRIDEVYTAFENANNTIVPLPQPVTGDQDKLLVVSDINTYKLSNYKFNYTELLENITSLTSEVTDLKSIINSKDQIIEELESKVLFIEKFIEETFEDYAQMKHDME